MKQNVKRDSVQNKGKRPMRGKQGRKDSNSKRINLDNERESKFEKDMCKGAKWTDARSNDVSWYAKTPELLRAAASLPFSITTGAKPEFTIPEAVPGVLRIRWTPAVGGSDGNPINQAANSKYSFTVHANSRNYAYDPADQMKMILAGSQVFSAIAAGLRAYGIMHRFEQRDYYTPQALVSAMGFSYTDLRSNLANMWYGLNELIARSQQIWIPNDMPVITRWFWLNSNIYRDGGSIKAQYYIFQQRFFWKYVLGTSLESTNLESVAWPDDCTWSQYLGFVDSLIQPLLDSQDRGIIFGDILKAYGPDKIYALNNIDNTYVVEPVYDREVLTQIENLTVIDRKSVV